jgi:hypothetical protein
MEVLRRSYRPEKVNVLFVGESPPAGGTFFYKGDSLTRCTMEAFENVYGINIDSHKTFLDRFKDNNFYLDDLCLVPVNNLNRTDRIETRRNSVPKLSLRLGDYSPKVIICFMYEIRPLIEKAVSLAELQEISFYSLPYPGHWQDLKKRYIQGLSDVLNELKTVGMIGSIF